MTPKSISKLQSNKKEIDTTTTTTTATTTVVDVEVKNNDDDAKKDSNKKEEKTATTIKTATQKETHLPKEDDDVKTSSEKKKENPPTMGDIAAKEKRKHDEIEQSLNTNNTNTHTNTHNNNNNNNNKKKKKKSKKAKKREREAAAAGTTKDVDAAVAVSEVNAAKKQKVSNGVAINGDGTAKWSFGDWTCQKCGGHNYRKQKDKCFRCSHPKPTETSIKQGNSAATQYLNGKLKDDKNWTFSQQEHEWCVRNSGFDPLMKDEVFHLFLKYLESEDMGAKHRDRVRTGATKILERANKCIEILKRFPSHEEEKEAKIMLFTEGTKTATTTTTDGEAAKKKKKKRNRKKKKQDKETETAVVAAADEPTGK